MCRMLAWLIMAPCDTEGTDYCRTQHVSNHERRRRRRQYGGCVTAASHDCVPRAARASVLLPHPAVLDPWPKSRRRGGDRRRIHAHVALARRSTAQRCHDVATPQTASESGVLSVPAPLARGPFVSTPRRTGYYPNSGPQNGALDKLDAVSPETQQSARAQ